MLFYSRDDITPELTKTFFENILRASDESPKLVVTKVKVQYSLRYCTMYYTSIFMQVFDDVLYTVV